MPKNESLTLAIISLCLAIALLSRLTREHGATLDCRAAVEASFCAVRVRDSEGISVQWGEGQRVTLWVWGEEGNWRVWPR